jgi:hypothetical protein
MELVRRFAREQYASALESWAWIGIADMVPICTSAFGDVFLQSANGTVSFLDTIEGTLTSVWESVAALQADLNTPEGRNQYLVPGLVAEAERRGIVPSNDQVLDFRIPPILGGRTDIDNVQVCSFVVCVNLSGQTHYMVKDLPPGMIDGFTSFTSGD